MKLLSGLTKAYASLRAIPNELRLQRLAANPPVLTSRDDLPLMLNIRNLRGRGVEIGVCKATFSEIVLNDWGGAKYHCVDPWREFPKEEYVDMANRPQDEQDKIMAFAKARLARFGDKVEFVRKTSLEAAGEFENESLDFVYIDGQHHYEAVRDDINAWLPKLKPGGLLCGHDYLDGFVDNCQFGVKKAVDEFVKGRGWSLTVSLEMEFPSWFVFLPNA